MRSTMAVMTTGLVLGLAACGDGGDGGGNRGAAGGGGGWSTADVLRLAGAERGPSGLGYQLTGSPSCPVVGLATSSQAVGLLRSGGQTVLSNPDGDAGVLLDDDETGACRAAWETAIGKVRR